jgi:hypothetical protein
MMGVKVRQRYCEGRDELNLADFPISVLQRQQPVGADGKKIDTAVYEASRFDRRTRERQKQKVVLEANARYGLPTPADENVILALLYIAKHSHDFSDPVVHFAPRQLFDIMGWAPNSRSYDRLRDVLRRLKALVIRYENSWWDIEGRSYEAELATGIISEYELGRQTGGRRKAGAPLPCWVSWSPQFHRSLQNGNLKKLDLERLFSLRLPTSQRMYRFLDKRFYPPHDPPEVDMDLYDFACGHIGLSRIDNVAELKRRLSPAIEELEGIGFIAAAPAAERFTKVRAGVWRVKFRSGRELVKQTPVPTEPARSAPEVSSAATLVREFYRLWIPDARHGPLASDLVHAQEMVVRHGEDKATAVLPLLVQVLRRHWPECKTFSGAATRYGADALRLYEQQQRRQELSARERQRGRLTQQQLSDHGARRRRLEMAWGELSEHEQHLVQQEVLKQHPDLARFPALLRDACLNRITMSSAAMDDGPDGTTAAHRDIAN